MSVRQRRPDQGSGAEQEKAPVQAQQAGFAESLSNNWILDLIGIGEPERAEQDERVNAQDVMLEQMAHRMVYQSELHDTDRELLAEWGYEPDWTFVSGEAGLQMALFRPAEGSDAAPVVAFRGTEPTEFADLEADLGPEIGSKQYEANREAIDKIFAEAGPDVDVVGHSLGASIAQIAATEQKGIRTVVGFQAPGVSQERVDQFEAMEDRPEVRYHLANDDLVDLGGEAHLPGDFMVHEPKRISTPLDAHVGYLLLNPQYQDAREDAGLTTERMRDLDEQNEGMFGVAHDAHEMTEVNPAEQYDAYHRQEAQDVVETVRQWLGDKLGDLPWWAD